MAQPLTAAAAAPPTAGAAALADAPAAQELPKVGSTVMILKAGPCWAQGDLGRVVSLENDLFQVRRTPNAPPTHPPACISP